MTFVRAVGIVLLFPFALVGMAAALAYVGFVFGWTVACDIADRATD